MWKIPILEGDYADFQDLEDLYNIAMVLFCVLCAGLAAGLTMGLVSFDVTKLEIRAMIGDEEEKKSANAIIPLVKRHHLLLVTLLLFNSIANESLPIFLGALVPNYIAILISVTLILIFGEIIPSALLNQLFTGKDQLLVASRFSSFVGFLIRFFWIIAFPISKLLDHLFGDEDHDGQFSRDELEALMLLQQNHSEEVTDAIGNGIALCPHNDYDVENPERRGNENQHSRLKTDEITIMTGVLRLSKIRVNDVMIPIGSVFKLSDSTLLNYKALAQILNTGYSRIPIYHEQDEENFLGYLLVKSLVVISPADGLRIESQPLRLPLYLQPDLGLLEALNILREAHCHLAFVSQDTERAAQSQYTTTNLFAPPPKVLGIVTMEDIIESILQRKITDETDAGSSWPIYNNILRTKGSTIPNSNGRNTANSRSCDALQQLDEDGNNRDRSSSTPSHRQSLRAHSRRRHTVHLANHVSSGCTSEDIREPLTKENHGNSSPMGNCNTKSEFDIEEGRKRRHSAHAVYFPEPENRWASQTPLTSEATTGIEIDRQFSQELFSCHPPQGSNKPSSYGLGSSESCCAELGLETRSEVKMEAAVSPETKFECSPVGETLPGEISQGNTAIIPYPWTTENLFFAESNPGCNESVEDTSVVSRLGNPADPNQLLPSENPSNSNNNSSVPTLRIDASMATPSPFKPSFDNKTWASPSIRLVFGSNYSPSPKSAPIEQLIPEMAPLLSSDNNHKNSQDKRLSYGSTNSTG